MTLNFGTQQQNGSTCWGGAMQIQASFMDSESAMVPGMGGWLFHIFKALEDLRQAGNEQLRFQLLVGTFVLFLHRASVFLPT